MRGRVFISYRRDDAPGDARGVCDRLTRKLGKANVFMDVDKLLAGQRFDRELDKALSQCDVLVAVIGPRWMELLSEYARGGKPDYVRDEIAAALKRDTVVIPVLVGREGHMPPLPQRNELPEDIRDLTLYQKQGIAHESFGRDTDELIAAINTVLRGKRRALPLKGIAIGGAAGLALAVAVFGYRGDLITWSGTRPNAPQPRPSAEGATVPAILSQSKSDADSAAEQAARQKAAEEEARRKAEDEAARKKAAADARKAAEDAVKRIADEQAAKRKAQDEADRKKAEEEAKRKADEQAGIGVVTDCDRLAASPTDANRPPGVAGIDPGRIDTNAAAAACDDAMRRYPAVTRFIYQAGRVAEARKDYARAMELYRAAIAKSNAPAMYALGVLYNFGLGVAQDYAEARNWYEKAAALGESYAMTNLGFLYSEGQGVPQDHVEARKWYEKAAALGDAQAMYNLGILYNDGDGVAQDYAEARKWYEKAAALGNSDAMFNLGVLYEDGLGVARDRKQARDWYQKAADAGDKEAKAKLARFK